MWGFGRVRLFQFLRLVVQLVPIAWQNTRTVSRGETIEFTVSLEVE
jgi:hypothetical protein